MDKSETGRAAGRLLRHMVFCERSDILLFGESVRALADLGQRADVVIGEFAVQHEAAQRIALPGRAVLGPFKDFFENSHLLIIRSMPVRDYLSVGPYQGVLCFDLGGDFGLAP